MRTYIAAVWYASSVTMDLDGWAGIRCRIIKGEAESPQMFEAGIRDDLGGSRDVDMTIEFGVTGEPWRTR
jgi:hypothetical protein